MVSLCNPLDIRSTKLLPPPASQEDLGSARFCGTPHIQPIPASLRCLGSRRNALVKIRARKGFCLPDHSKDLPQTGEFRGVQPGVELGHVLPSPHSSQVTPTPIFIPVIELAGRVPALRR